MSHGVYSIRILYMPAVYAIISFFSFRFFRSFTYYALVETGELIPRFSSALCFSTLRLVYEVRSFESFSEM